MTESNAGIKIDSKILYQRQKTISSRPGPTIVADNLQTPANIASVFRLADAANAAQIIFLQHSTNNFTLDKNIQRLSRNTTHIKNSYLSYDDFIKQSSTLPALIAIELTSTAGNILETALPAECCFVVGSERHGISEEILNCCTSAVYIPMYGVNGSMNVSHALAICLYEWRQQHSTT